MKRVISAVLLITLAFVLISCDKDSDPSSPGDGVSASVYYPGQSGSTFTYSVTTDGVSSGQRIVTISSTSELGGNYLKQTSVMDTSTAVTYVRRTDSGVYFYVDTTGLADFIPDSLQSVLTLTLDEEVTAFVKTFNTTVDWVAFKMDVNFLTIPYNVINVSSHYEGSEDISAIGGTSTYKAEKVRYDMRYTIPNLSGGQPQVRTFTARVWFVKDIGIARLEGNATVLNAIGGGGIDFADTSKVMTQSLLSYDIKN